jgi:hypothetical protein
VTSGKNLMAEVIDSFERSWQTGEPLDGPFFCAICKRGPDEGVRQYIVKIVTPASERKHTNGGRGVIRSKGRDLIDYQFRLICPCCSFDACPHPKDPSCRSCGRPTGPGWATRCAFDGNHPSAAAAAVPS